MKARALRYPRSMEARQIGDRESRGGVNSDRAGDGRSVPFSCMAASSPFAVAHGVGGSGFRMRAILFSLILVLGLPLLTFAGAQGELCSAELRDAAERTEPSAPRIATAVARAALEALEPAYPAFHAAGTWEDPNARWLQARGWLPEDWSETVFEESAWQDLLRKLYEPYGATAEVSGGDATAEGLIWDVQLALAAGTGAVRPLGLLATEDGENDRVVFAAVIWNWTPIPRLLLFEARGEDLVNGRPTEEVLRMLGTCAWQAERWMAAGESDVASYYLGNVDSGIILLARDDESLRTSIEAGAEEAVFHMTHPELRNSQSASLAFTGPGPSVGQLFSLLFSVRANVSVLDLPYHLAIP